MIPISIIIPAYNEEKSIARAIKSATAQSLKNIEIIVVNDASTDKTAEIVKQIASTDNRVKLISHNKNMGLNQSRLTGLSIAQGEYIQFLDADDSLEKNAIEQLYSHAKSHNLDMVMMGSQHYHKYLKFKITIFYPDKYFKKTIYNSIELMPNLLCKLGFPLSLWDKFYRKELLNSVWTTAEHEFYGEDMLTNIRIFNTDASLGWIDYIGYNWTTGGASKKSATDTWEDDKKLYNRCRSVLEEINASTAENLHALACGAVNSFIYSISQQLVNPFASKRKCKEWIKTELQSDFWDNVIPFLGSSHIAICNRDADSTLEIARHHLNAHRLSFLALKFLMQ